MKRNPAKFPVFLLLLLALVASCDRVAEGEKPSSTAADPEPIPDSELWMPGQFTMHLKMEQPYNPYLNANGQCWESEECNFYYKVTDNIACMKAEFNGFCPPLPGAPQLNTAYSCWIYAMRYIDPADQSVNYSSYYVRLGSDGEVLSCCAFTPDIGPVRRDFLIRVAKAPWLGQQDGSKVVWSTVPPALQEIDGTPASLFLTSTQMVCGQDETQKLLQGNFAVAYEPTTFQDSIFHAPLYIGGHSPWLVPLPNSGTLLPVNLMVPDSNPLYKTAFGRMRYYDFRPSHNLPDSLFALPEACSVCRQLIEGPADTISYIQLKKECSCYGDGLVMNIPPATPGTGSCTTCHHGSDKWQALLTDSALNAQYGKVRELIVPEQPKLDSQEIREMAALLKDFESPCPPGPTVPLPACERKE